MRSEMDCRREGPGGVIAGCPCCTAAGMAGKGPNMESMVGRNAAPKGVDRKSEGRSVVDVYVEQFLPKRWYCISTRNTG
jgi:hypothetical protein